MNQTPTLTTDGYEIRRGEHCYLERGQCAILRDSMKGSEGEMSYLVAPFYEGEAMKMECYGDNPVEVSAPYEIEGEKTIVSHIFKVAPTEKLDSVIASKTKELSVVSTAIAISKAEQQEATTAMMCIVHDTNNAGMSRQEAGEALAEAQGLLKEENEKVDAARQQLSEYEDAIPEQIDGDSVKVSKAELARLNKREFYLECLEGGGVDNWEWIDESLKAYRERYPAE